MWKRMILFALTSGMLSTAVVKLARHARHGRRRAQRERHEPIERWEGEGGLVPEIAEPAK